jgi:hypothetical protein
MVMTLLQRQHSRTESTAGVLRQHWNTWQRIIPLCWHSIAASPVDALLASLMEVSARPQAMGLKPCTPYKTSSQSEDTIST